MSGPYGSGSFGTVAFSNTPLYNTKTLIDAVLRDTGHSNPSTETAKRLVVLSFLNNRYATVTTSRHWDWLYQSEDITLDAPFTTGTVSATKGSNVVTGSGTGWTAALLPYKKLVICDYIHTVIAVNSPTEIEIESEWAGTSVTDSAYKIVSSVFQLPATCEHVRGLSVDGVSKLVPIGIQEMRRKQQYDPGLTGSPYWFTEVGRRAEDGIRYVEVFPAPDAQYNAHMDYNVNIMALEDSETSFPLIPDRHRVVLYYGALAEMYRYLRDPANAQSAETHFLRTLTAMQNDTQLTDSRLIIQPGRRYKKRRTRRYRTAMDREDFGRYE